MHELYKLLIFFTAKFPLSENLPIHFRVAGDHLLGREFRAGALLSCLAKALRKGWIFKELMGVAGESGTIAYGHEKAGLSMKNKIAGAGRVAGHYRNSGGHGFQNDTGLVFIGTGRPEQVEVRHKPGQIAAQAEEMHKVGDADLIAEPPELFAVWSIADNEQVNVLADDLQQVGGPNGILYPIAQ